jgi:hypothetical protein
MKRFLLAVAAIVAIGFTTSSAQAGGWGGHHHHHCRPYRPPVCATYAYRPPVVYQPYYYQPYAYVPQNAFYYSGRNFGMQFGW